MRVAAYVRVSSDEQVQGFSLAAQERAIATHAEHQGWEIVAWFRDEGLSARVDDVAKRPAFQAMLEAAQERRFDVIVVHKLDRFARNRRVAFNTFAHLADWRVGFVSIAENMDYSTPAGQLMLTMLVGMSQFYSDNLSWETKKGKAERKQRGIYNGLLPFGVMIGAGGVPVPDTRPWACNLLTRDELIPHQGLVRAFELCGAGASDREIARTLTDLGYRTSGNRGQNPFTKDSVRVILRNRFYVGDLPDGDGWVPGKHAPIIDVDLFEHAQQMRARFRNRQFATPGRRKPWCLSGMVRCGECGAPLRIRGGTSDVRYVGCGARSQDGRCRAPGFSEPSLVDAIADVLARVTTSPRARELALGAWKAHRSADVDHQAQRLVIDRKLVRLRELYLDGDIVREEYHRRRDELTAERDALPVDVLTDDAMIERLWVSIDEAARRFPTADPLTQQAICRALFSKAVVHKNRAVELFPRPEICPFFATGGSDGDSSGGWQTISDVVVLQVAPSRPMRPGENAELIAWVGTQDGRTLRDLSREIGVSYETVRKLRRLAHDRKRLSTTQG